MPEIGSQLVGRAGARHIRRNVSTFAGKSS
jgi:hypothetical protein